LDVVKRILARLTFAVASFFLAFGPLLDTAAKSVPDDLPQNVVAQALRAFDVLDDSLDHAQGLPTAPVQLHLQLPHAFPEPVEVPSSNIVAQADWETLQERLPVSVPSGGLERPPRA